MLSITKDEYAEMVNSADAFTDFAQMRIGAHGIEYAQIESDETLEHVVAYYKHEDHMTAEMFSSNDHVQNAVIVASTAEAQLLLGRFAVNAYLPS